MKYPILTELNTSREMIDVFRGYNHNLRIGEGEFYDMKNLCSDHYPILSPRPKRGTYATPINPQGMLAKDALCYVDCVTPNHADGARLYINEKEVEDFTLSSRTADCPKTLISMGAYIIIMPDKKYVNTESKNYSDKGNIEATVEMRDLATFVPCKLDGTEYKAATARDTAPENPADLDLWLDTSSVPHTLKQYSSSNATWVSIPTTYIKITCSKLSPMPFETGDGIIISGITNESLLDFNRAMVIEEAGDKYIIVKGILDEATVTSGFTIKRVMPNMDFIIESENRLWGCRYGTDVNGNVVNEIYASKLGDFKNWNCFASVSTDSYVATVGTDGQFTGATTHLGYPIFFKENCMHKVYGNYPANYQIQTTTCRGVQAGCDRSLATVNEVLYYKSRSGICAYDGSLPVEISSALGDTRYYNAVAGGLGNKYYISMAEADESYHLFVYDTLKGMWHKEDNTQASIFCNYRGDLCYIDYDDNQIKSVKGTGVTEINSIEWEAVTGIIGTDSPDKKYISRMDVRMSLQVGTRVMFFIEYDSSGEWEHLFTMAGVNLRSFPVSIRPQRCDHMRLRIKGVGDAKIYSICKTIEQGSDI